MGGTLWLDGVTASLAAGALAAAVLFEIVLVTTEGSPATVLTNLSYPLGGVLLLSAVVGAFSLIGWRPGPRRSLIGLGVLCTARRAPEECGIAVRPRVVAELAASVRARVASERPVS